MKRPRCSSALPQKQYQISKQKQIRDQTFSFNIMGGLLSALESYANKCNPIKSKQTNIFSAYNNFNCGNVKTKEQLKNQIITQLIVVEASYKIYVNDYGKYDFPNNLSQRQMINYIKLWASWVPKEDSKYFASAVAILEGKDPQQYINELQGSGEAINPNWFIANIQVIHNANQVGEDAVKQFNEKGIMPQMELNSKKIGNRKINDSAFNEYERRKRQEDMDNKFDYLINKLYTFNTQSKQNDRRRPLTQQTYLGTNYRDHGYANDYQNKSNYGSKSHNNQEHLFSANSHNYQINRNYPSYNQPKQQQRMYNPKQNSRYPETNTYINIDEIQQIIQDFGNQFYEFKEKYQIYIYKNNRTKNSQQIEKLNYYLGNAEMKGLKRNFFQTFLDDLSPYSYDYL